MIMILFYIITKPPQNNPGDDMLKYILAWLPMILIAIANGLLRENVLTKFLSELRAHQASTATMILFFGIYIWGVTKLWKPESAKQALLIGLIWLVMTVIFEFGFGHFIMGHPWSRLFHDYNLMAGRVWILVLIWVTAAPSLFYRLANT